MINLDITVSYYSITLENHTTAYLPLHVAPQRAESKHNARWVWVGNMRIYVICHLSWPTSCRSKGGSVCMCMCWMSQVIRLSITEEGTARPDCLLRNRGADATTGSTCVRDVKSRWSTTIKKNNKKLSSLRRTSSVTSLYLLMIKSIKGQTKTEAHKLQKWACHRRQPRCAIVLAADNM